MKYLAYTFLFIILFTFFSCSTPTTKIDVSHHKVSSEQSELILILSIPQNSGLAFIGYDDYVISGNKLYVVSKSPKDLRAIDSNRYSYDTLAIYNIKDSLLQELSSTILENDSIVGCQCMYDLGWYGTRFFIKSNYRKRNINIGIYNCYRKNVFKVIDIMNKIYPKRNLITYDKNHLIASEKECLEHK